MYFVTCYPCVISKDVTTENVNQFLIGLKEDTVMQVLAWRRQHIPVSKPKVLNTNAKPFEFGAWRAQSLPVVNNTVDAPPIVTPKAAKPKQKKEKPQTTTTMEHEPKKKEKQPNTKQQGKTDTANVQQSQDGAEKKPRQKKEKKQQQPDQQQDVVDTKKKQTPKKEQFRDVPANLSYAAALLKPYVPPPAPVQPKASPLQSTAKQAAIHSESEDASSEGDDKSRLTKSQKNRLRKKKKKQEQMDMLEAIKPSQAFTLSAILAQEMSGTTPKAKRLPMPKTVKPVILQIGRAHV